MADFIATFFTDEKRPKEGQLEAGTMKLSCPELTLTNYLITLELFSGSFFPISQAQVYTLDFYF